MAEATSLIAPEDSSRLERTIGFWGLTFVSLVKPIPNGIALRPGDSRIDGIQTAVKDMYETGKMGSILTKWKFNRYAINP